MIDPIIAESATKNTFAQDPTYHVTKRQDIVTYQGKSYTKITYAKKHGLMWRIAMGTSAIFGSLSLLPLMFTKGRARIKALWNRARSGNEKKVVLIAQLPAKKNEKKEKKHVQFGEARVREFYEGDHPSEVSKTASFSLFLTDSPKPARRKKTAEKKSESIETTQERKYPPTGMLDTLIRGRSAHGQGNLFQEEEIAERCDIERKVEFGRGTPITGETNIVVYYTKYGKPILQQQSVRGCVAAAAAMIIMDKGKQPNIPHLSMTNLGNEEDQKKDINDAGLKPLSITLSQENFLSDLRKSLLANGSAIVSIDGEIGGHVLVVDGVSETFDNVRLRDPYHGWEITVTAEAFMKRNPSLEIMHARENPA